MPSINDLANSVRRPINKAVKYEKENKSQEAAVCFLTSATQALTIAWLLESNPKKKEQIHTARELVGDVYTREMQLAITR